MRKRRRKRENESERKREGCVLLSKKKYTKLMITLKKR